eukprot:5190458-Pyramimonas_sp.AAC.1
MWRASNFFQQLSGTDAISESTPAAPAAMALAGEILGPPPPPPRPRAGAWGRLPRLLVSLGTPGSQTS